MKTGTPVAICLLLLVFYIVHVLAKVPDRIDNKDTLLTLCPLLHLDYVFLVKVRIVPSSYSLL